MVAKLTGVDSREAAAALTGRDVLVERQGLPAPVDGEYYWCDLIGLKVVGLSGCSLGRVLRLFETGSNDVLVVGREEHLVPFVMDKVVKEVNFELGLIRVDWDVNY